MLRGADRPVIFDINSLYFQSYIKQTTASSSLRQPFKMPVTDTHGTKQDEYLNQYIFYKNMCIFFLIVSVVGIVVFLAGIQADCIGDCFSHRVSADGNMHFISTHLAQCKYSDYDTAWPWALLLCVLALALQWKLSVRRMTDVVLLDVPDKTQSKNLPIPDEKALLDHYQSARIINTFASVGFVCTAVGFWMVVFFDNIAFPKYDAACPQMLSSSCQRCINPAPYDPTGWHGAGVIILTFGGIALQHGCVLFYYLTAVRSTRGGYLRRESYICVELIYVFVWVAFIICYVLDNHDLSIRFEYALVVAVLLMSLINLIILVHMNERMRITLKLIY